MFPHPRNCKFSRNFNLCRIPSGLLVLIHIELTLYLKSSFLVNIVKIELIKKNEELYVILGHRVDAGSGGQCFPATIAIRAYVELAEARG